ncbi:FadR/GntR family transcriptional regulator [Streptomyces sp. NBC_00483]|uniref:FadR/GntR family transcriptional regulator n=1 Tax=Streptomyces sp. NBC_00483 TaxID=2975756 RepID=UPI002E19CFB8
MGTSITIGALPGEKSGTLTNRVEEMLLSAVVSGRFEADTRLPQEGELAEELGVSRLTLREALRSLQRMGVLRVERGRGTFVNARARWSHLDPTVLAAMIDAGQGTELYRSLTELRRMVETGLVGLAAERRDDEHLVGLEAAVERMQQACDTHDVQEFAAADMDFHGILLDAADNPLVLGIYELMNGALRRVREQTTRRTIGDASAVVMHRGIFDAVAAGDAAAAVAAMNRHFDNTDRYVSEVIELMTSGARKDEDATSA